MLRALKTLGIWEAASYIALVGVAMPLKYIGDEPLAVSICGAIHGGLWVAYILLIGIAWQRRVVTPRLGLILSVLSLIPFGPLLAHHRLVEPTPADWKRRAELED